MITVPKVGMYVLKRHIDSGRYIIGKIIKITDEGELDLEIISCKEYGYGFMGENSYISTYISNNYEIFYVKNQEELLAKVL